MNDDADDEDEDEVAIVGDGVSDTQELGISLGITSNILVFRLSDTPGSSHGLQSNPPIIRPRHRRFLHSLQDIMILPRPPPRHGHRPQNLPTLAQDPRRTLGRADIADSRDICPHIGRPHEQLHHLVVIRPVKTNECRVGIGCVR